MLTFFIITLMISTTIVFLVLHHPLSFGIILLIQTSLTAMITGMLNLNYWFSYILFLIMIGGMLVLFIYMTRIASNEKFKFSIKLLFICLSTLMMSMIMLLIDFYFSLFKSINYSVINQPIYSMNSLSMNKFMNYPNNLILTMTIIYLLITLIAIVKITDSQYGPLRQKF